MYHFWEFQKVNNFGSRKYTFFSFVLFCSIYAHNHPVINLIVRFITEIMRISHGVVDFKNELVKQKNPNHVTININWSVAAIFLMCFIIWMQCGHTLGFVSFKVRSTKYIFSLFHYHFFFCLGSRFHLCN